MLHINLKRITKCSSMVANILPAETYPLPSTPPPPTLQMGTVGQNSTFSEHSRVAYQLKENQECSNMVANIFPTESYPPHPTPRPTLGMGSPGQNSIISEHGQRESQMQQHCSKYLAGRHPTLGMGSIGQNSTFSEYDYGAYQIKENHECSNMVANILPADPPPPQP